MTRVRLIGIGPGGLDQVTVEAVRAMNEVAAFIVLEKSTNDPLRVFREALIDRHVAVRPPVIVVPDPPRDRSVTTEDTAGYEKAVADWHQARTAALSDVLASIDGDAGFLVWGDPSLYDSTLRVLQQVPRVAIDVIPGVPSIQLLAARHQIVLHDVGQPVHVTSARRLAEAVSQGQRNIVVMLMASADCLSGLEQWHVWWGANLGTEGERLVRGRVGHVLDDIVRHRDGVKAEYGWVMDACLVRAP